MPSPSGWVKLIVCVCVLVMCVSVMCVCVCVSYSQSISDGGFPLVFPTSCLLQIRGEAEAFAVEAKGRAEAEQMAKKAEAFEQNKDGAMVDMLLEKLPLVRDDMRLHDCHLYDTAVGSYCLS